MTTGRGAWAAACAARDLRNPWATSRSCHFRAGRLDLQPFPRTSERRMTIPATMTCIEITAPGAPDVLNPTTRPTPKPARGEVLVKVAAAGVNRPDVLQRLGKYPPPAAPSDLPRLHITTTAPALTASVTTLT